MTHCKMFPATSTCHSTLNQHCHMSNDLIVFAHRTGLNTKGPVLLPSTVNENSPKYNNNDRKKGFPISQSKWTGKFRFFSFDAV